MITNLQPLTISDTQVVSSSKKLSRLPFGPGTYPGTWQPCLHGTWLIFEVLRYYSDHQLFGCDREVAI